MVVINEACWVVAASRCAGACTGCAAGARAWQERNDIRTFPNAELLGLPDQLQRNDQDLRQRLAMRVEALGGAAASISDPLYQRHYFAVQSLEAHRPRVESELVRRDACW
jgi:hypothetical protein